MGALLDSFATANGLDRQLRLLDSRTLAVEKGLGEIHHRMEDRVNGLDERLSVMDARLVVTQEQILVALRTTEKRTDHRLRAVEERLGTCDKRMVSLLERLNYMENCLSQILVQLSLAEERYGNIENRVGNIENRVGNFFFLAYCLTCLAQINLIDNIQQELNPDRRALLAEMMNTELSRSKGM